MYAHPALTGAVAAWWEGLRGHLAVAGLAGVPEALTEPGDLTAHWRDPRLLLSQTCGRPYRHALADAVQIVATPCYAAAGCDGADYRSFLVVRADDGAQSPADLAGRTVAVNAWDSHSGDTALRCMVAAATAPGEPFFARARVTGSHRASLVAVAASETDCAAVDSVVWAIVGRHEPDIAGALRVIAESDAVPGLPLVSALATPADDMVRLRDGLAAAFADDALADTRRALLLAGIAWTGAEDYARHAAMEAVARGVTLCPDDPAAKTG